jgi:formylglycine-generating enzyme required for sulfatase activity
MSMRPLFFLLATSIMATIWLSSSFWSNTREANLSGAIDHSEPESTGRFLQSVGFLPNDSLLGFVRVEEGDFLMGSDPLRDSLFFPNEIWPDKSPKQIRELPEFYMGRYEVTIGQFREFKKETGYPLNISGESLEHPVSGVSWPDAIAYALWVDEKLRGWSEVPSKLRELLEEGWMVSLPSEMEWEKAARGKDGRRYPWGDKLEDDSGNFRTQETVRVGSLACTECVYGLSDMSGNVWEWTRSSYRDYPITNTSNSLNVDLERDALWVMRGGSFADTERYVRSATRGAADPGVKRPFIGFRLALSRFRTD